MQRGSRRCLGAIVIHKSGFGLEGAEAEPDVRRSSYERDLPRRSHAHWRRRFGSAIVLFAHK